MSQYLRIMRWLIWKDLKYETRRREIFSSMLLFAAVILILFHFALGGGERVSVEAASGILWVTLTFSAVLGLNRIQSQEQEGALQDALLMSAVDRSVFYLARVVVSWFFLGLLMILLLPLLQLFFGSPAVSWRILPVGLLGSLGIALSGVLLAGVGMQSRLRDTLLSVLLFPVLLPLLLSVMHATSLVFSGQPLRSLAGMQLVIVYDLIFLALGLMLAPILMEE